MATETLLKVTYGMYIVSTKDGPKMNGLVINTATQVTSSPPCISIFISKENHTHDIIINSGSFSISILKKDTPMKFIGKWGFRSGRDVDKFKDVNYRTGKTGAPIVLENAVGYMDLRLLDHFSVGTHTIFIGEVVDSGMIDDAEPLTYAYYRSVKGGRSPKNAPTYDGWAESKGKEKSFKRFNCGVCGYVYDPVTGDKKTGTEPNTPFENLPDEWFCPRCKASKKDFSALK